MRDTHKVWTVELLQSTSVIQINDYVRNFLEGYRVWQWHLKNIGGETFWGKLFREYMTGWCTVLMLSNEPKSVAGLTQTYNTLKRQSSVYAVKSFKSFTELLSTHTPCLMESVICYLSLPPTKQDLTQGHKSPKAN